MGCLEEAARARAQEQEGAGCVLGSVKTREREQGQLEPGVSALGLCFCVS